jgi:hypothetical protein
MVAGRAAISPIQRFNAGNWAKSLLNLKRTIEGLISDISTECETSIASDRIRDCHLETCIFITAYGDL